MARAVRVGFEEVFYHVMPRGDHREAIVRGRRGSRDLSARMGPSEQEPSALPPNPEKTPRRRSRLAEEARSNIGNSNIKWLTPFLAPFLLSLS